MELPDATKIYLGTENVEKVMLGDTQVWPYQNPFAVPDYISGNTVAFKRLDGNASSVTLYNCYEEDGHLSLNIPLFSDSNGNDLVPTNAVVRVNQYLKTYTADFDANGWAVFRFNSPVHSVACAVEPTSTHTVYPVVPSTVKVLAGFFGLGSFDTEVQNRFYIPEGVETLSGNCVFMTKQFNNGSVYIPSTVQTIGIRQNLSSDTGNERNALYRWHNSGPKLFYYNGTFSDYKNITWLGEIEYYYAPMNERGYAGYPVKCTDGVFYTPND